MVTATMSPIVSVRIPLFLPTIFFPASVEHGFAHLKNSRVRGKVRPGPKWTTSLVRALLVLTNREVAPWPTTFAEVIMRSAQ